MKRKQADKVDKRKKKKRLEDAVVNPLKRPRDVHVMMDHDVYVKVRQRLFETTLTLPECIEEFARLIVAEDALAEQVIHRCYKNKMKREIEKLQASDAEQAMLDKIDNDMLYTLIEEDGEEEEDVREEDDR